MTSGWCACWGVGWGDRRFAGADGGHRRRVQRNRVQSENSALRGRRRLPNRRLLLVGSKDGVWVYTDQNLGVQRKFRFSCPQIPLRFLHHSIGCSGGRQSRQGRISSGFVSQAGARTFSEANECRPVRVLDGVNQSRVHPPNALAGPSSFRAAGKDGFEDARAEGLRIRMCSPADATRENARSERDCPGPGALPGLLEKASKREGQQND